ncbi:MAG: pilus assembly protein PilM [Candidatus Omnitrophota bacterium]
MFWIKRMNPIAAVVGHDLVGIELDGNNLKIAHMRISPGRAEAVNLVVRNISGMADADISKTIASSFLTLNAKNPYVVSVITSGLAITKNIEIPSIDPKEIKEIIDLQAGRHTPYSREEIVIDYIDVGTYKNTYTKILLVIVSRNVIKKQFDIIGKAGLKLEKILFAPEALGRSAARVMGLNTEVSPASIINIDESFTDFTVVYKNRLLFVRSIPIGVQQLWEDREKNGIRFAEELKRSLETYQGENIERSPDSLILTGAAEEMTGLEPVLNDALHFPLKVIPYLKNVTVKGDLLKVNPAARRQSFLNIMASLFALEQVKIILIPEEVKVRRSLEERGRDLIKTGIFVFTAFMILCLILVSNIFFKTAYLKNLTVKYRDFDKEAQTLENKFTMVSMVRNYLSSRGYSLEVLAELHSITPIDLELNDIRFDDQGKISIKGTAESMSTVFSFVEAIGKSKYFKDAKTKYTSKRKEGTKDMADFEITAALNKNR